MSLEVKGGKVIIREDKQELSSSPILSTKEERFVRIGGGGEVETLQGEELPVDSLALLKKIPDRLARRIKPEEIEAAYRFDGSFQMLTNKIVSSVVGKRIIFDASKADVKKIDKWLEDMNIDITKVFYTLVLDNWLHGMGVAVVIPTTDGTNIASIVPLDSKAVDFATEHDGAVSIDDFGNPIGYRVTGIRLPDALFKDQILPRKMTFSLTIFPIAGSFRGVAPAEGAYKGSLIKVNVEDVLGTTAYRKGSPIPKATVGNQFRPQPTDEEINDLDKQLMNPTALTHLVLPWWIQFEMVDTEASQSITALATAWRSLVDYQAIVLGYPKNLVSSEILRGSESLISAQKIELEKFIETIRERINTQYRQQLGIRMRDVLGLSDIPNIKWEVIDVEMRTSKARRLAALGRSQLVTWDRELENALRKSEDLPLLPKPEEQPIPIQKDKQVPEDKQQPGMPSPGRPDEEGMADGISTDDIVFIIPKRIIRPKKRKGGDRIVEVTKLSEQDEVDKQIDEDSSL